MCDKDLLGAFYKLFYLQFCDSSDQLKKQILAMWKIFLHENNRNYNSYKFSYKFAFAPFLSFLRNQKQESKCQQVVGLASKKISTFWLESLEFNKLLCQCFF